MKKNLLYMALLLLVALLIDGCTPIKSYHGKNITEKDLSPIKVNSSTKSDVLAQLGSPTILDQNLKDNWVYIYKKTSRKAFFDQKVELYNAVQFYFDKKGVLKKIKKLDKSALQRIEMDKEITKSQQKEESILKQIFGNFGQMGGSSSSNNDGI